MKNISTVIKLSSIVCIGGMLTACSTSQQGRASYNDSSSSAYSSTRMGTTADTSMEMSESRQSDSYVSEASGANRQYSESQEIIIPLHEERLNVGKQTVEAGQVRLRKVVTTETVNRPVELRHETVVIERIDANGQVQQIGQTQGSTGANSNRSLAEPFEQGEITIRLTEERPVVEKETVVTGRVVARKASETDRQSISREVRREDVRLDRSGDTANINVKGEFREAAGAQTQRQQSDINQNDADIDASINTNTSTSTSAETSTSIQSNQPLLQTNPNAEIPDARGNARNNPAVETSPNSSDNQQ